MAGSAPPPTTWCHTSAGASEKRTRSSTVASTSTATPRSAGAASTFPALEVSTRGADDFGPELLGEGGARLVGTLAADGDPRDGRAAGHPVTEEGRGSRVEREEAEEDAADHEGPPAAPRRGRLLPVDLVVQAVEGHAMLP